MNSISFSSLIAVRIDVEPRRRASVSVGIAPAAARVAVRAAATPAEAGAGTAKRQPRGITKPKPVSPALQAVVGVKEIPRTQALKVIWAYIKENNLQVRQLKGMGFENVSNSAIQQTCMSLREWSQSARYSLPATRTKRMSAIQQTCMSLRMISTSVG